MKVAQNKSEKLKKLASISTGYTFREKVTDALGGEVWVIQMRDVHSEPPYMRRDEMVRIDREAVRSSNCLEPSDILVVSRGFRFQVVTIGEEFAGAIASSAFLVIRCDTKKLLPDYLAWYLNQPQYHQRLLALGSTTSGVFVVRKQQLENLEIHLPPIREQVKVAELAKLHEKESVLYRTIAEERDKLVNASLQSFINPKSIKQNGPV
ncbi:MAG: restriction endonuclease subunit S [Cyclobacteriaceae bacterium]